MRISINVLVMVPLVAFMGCSGGGKQGVGDAGGASDDAPVVVPEPGNLDSAIPDGRVTALDTAVADGRVTLTDAMVPDGRVTLTDAVVPDGRVTLTDAVVPDGRVTALDTAVADGRVGTPDGASVDVRPVDTKGTDSMAATDTALPSLTCAALPASGGAVVNVQLAQASSLPSLLRAAAAGTTFMLAPGTYTLAESLRFDVANLTLRSSTDRAADVVIDAAYVVNEALVVRASNVTIAHVTITRAVDHAIHMSPLVEGVNVTGTLIYGVALTDNGEQFLKVNPLGTAAGYVDKGRVECSTFLLTDAGRPHIERSTGGCYTGGIDAHAAQDWIVRNNRFEGIYCAGDGLAEHAVHFWKRSRGTLVENNIIINCARGIGFGMGDTNTGTRVYPDAPYGGADLGHIDGIIRNNVIWATIDFFDTGIELMQTRQPIVVHNTVVSSGGAGFFSSIDYRWGRTQVVLQNNLTGRITVRDGATGTVDHNLETTPLSYFTNPTSGDFHLTASASNAIDRGIALAEAGMDMDGEAHGKGLPDLGADER